MPIHLHLKTSSKGNLLLHCSILFRKLSLKFRYLPPSWLAEDVASSGWYHFRYLKNGEMCAFRIFPPRVNRIYSIISHGRFQSLINLITFLWNCISFTEYFLNCSSQNWTLYFWQDPIKMEYNRTFFFWPESYNYVNAT